MNQNARITWGLLGAMLGGAVALVTAAVWLTRGVGAAHAAVTLFVTGDTRGYLEPCGCRQDQAGGLPGRLTLVRQNETPERLLVDVGNLTSGGRSYELLKLRYLLEGMSRMNYDAINLGRREAGLDRETLRKILAENALPFVSCNVLDSSKGAPLAAPFLVKRVAGVRVGITGVTEIEEDEVGPGVQVRPAAESLAETLPKMKGECDYVVVLAFVSQESLKRLAERFHEIGCLLGGDVAQTSEKAETLNRAVAFSVTDKGKTLGKLTFRRSEKGLTCIDSAALKVKDTILPAPEMTALLTDYKNSLRERSIEFASEEGLDPIASAHMTADSYAGQKACAPCHPQAHKINDVAAHSHALETLALKKSEYDPECLRCHTVGYGARDGYLNFQRTPQFAGVQCENCHGRGGDHIKAMQSGQRRASAFRPVTPNTCVRCHDKENSLHFLYKTYWPKIVHGKG